MVINKHANSLCSLIADGRYRATSLGRNTWKTLIGSQASLQTNCNKEGFNAVSASGVHAKARLASLAISKMTATAVTPESGLVQESLLKTPTRVETRHCGHQIMETNTSKPWDTSWCSEKNGLVTFQDRSRKLNVVKEIKHGGGNKCCF